MKNFIFMLLCAFTFVSCEQEEVWSELQTGGNENELPLTRSASDVPNAINQLDGIPVNIKSVANGRYLSAESRGEGIYLAPNDDGSLRQRWNIGIKVNAYINLIGGNSTYANGRLVLVSQGESYFPQLLDSRFPSSFLITTSGDGVTYNIMVQNGISFEFSIPTT